MPAPTAHRAQLAGNVITLDWTLDPNGYTEEENKVINETKKIMGDASIGVSPTCVRVPVRVATAKSINVEFDRPIIGGRGEGGAGEGPRRRAHGRDARASSRSRSTPRGATTRSSAACGRTRATRTRLNLWVVADNLRKGAATNAVQCAEELVKRGIVK